MRAYDTGTMTGHAEVVAAESPKATAVVTEAATA
jgi:hypothetical protein